MAAFPTTPHGPAPSTGAGGPVVINVRRPRVAPGEAPIAAELVIKPDELLPTTVLRLPNLAAIPASRGTLNKVLSIAHWCFIGLGSLLALWLIFGGRGGPKPTGDELPAAAPVRAQADTTSAWNPPPLDTAGDSDAPKWTPPAASAAPAAATPTVPEMNYAPPAMDTAPADMDMAPPAGAPAAASSPAPAETESPSHESWPQGGGSAPAEPAAPKADSLPEPQLPAQAWQDPGQSPAAATAGPVARTAARETPAPDAAPGGEAHPLDLTVPVPQ